MSVIRLRGLDKRKILELAEKIFNSWKLYSDADLEILSHSGDIPHNTITPIARRRGDKFELDLVLRNNRISEEHPLGIFHPHAEYHHIKKENIGLIEVMGLAVLPSRLLKEIDLMKKALADPTEAQDIMSCDMMKKHKNWYEQLSIRGLKKENIEQTIKDDIGSKFVNILADAGVFKDDVLGNEGFLRFCKSV